MKNVSPQYFPTIFLLVILLSILVVVVSCTPQLTDAELEAELAKLTPEQREQLLADLEAKEGGAFAGQAVSAGMASKYGMSPRVAGIPKDKMKIVVQKSIVQLVQKCADTEDKSELGSYNYVPNPLLKGTISGRRLLIGYLEGDHVFEAAETFVDACKVHKTAYGNDGDNVPDNVFYEDAPEGACGSEDIGISTTYYYGGKPSMTIVVDGCFVQEYKCSYHDNTIVDEINVGSFPVIISDYYTSCPYGCHDGVCNLFSENLS